MTEGAGQLKPLWQRIVDTPLAFDARLAADRLAELDATAHEPPAPFLAEPAVRKLIVGVFGSSPYLSGLILRDPARLARILGSAPELHMTQLGHKLDADMAAATAPADAMRILRQYKTEVALLVALADLAGAWPVMTAPSAAAVRMASCASSTASSKLCPFAPVKPPAQPRLVTLIPAPRIRRIQRSSPKSHSLGRQAAMRRIPASR
jgi:glutamate-ammonia-ligase adenylyltransferase